MGHLEACAAAAGLASLLATSVRAGVVAMNTQLLRLYIPLGDLLYTRLLGVTRAG